MTNGGGAAALSRAPDARELRKFTERRAVLWTVSTAEVSPNTSPVLGLRPGEVVRVRSASEIFATLDDRGTLDGLPFMPEMLKYCGRTLPGHAAGRQDVRRRRRRAADAQHGAPPERPL